MDGQPGLVAGGMIAVANAHKEKVKVTFSHGASLADPDKVFNAGLNGKVWRAIDLSEGDKLNAAGLKKLVRAAIVFNQAKQAKKATARPRAKAAKGGKA